MKKKVLCLICSILFIVPLLVSCRSGYKYDYDDLGKYITLPDYKNKVIEIERDYIQNTIDDTLLGYATTVYSAQAGDNIYVDLTFKKVKWVEGDDGKIDQYGDEITELAKKDFLIENVGAGSYCSQIEEIFASENSLVTLGKEYEEMITLDNSFPVEEYRGTEVYLTYKFSSINARRGDVVYVTYTGYYLDDNGNIKTDDDGEEETFDSGSATFYLGSHMAIDDFENNLIGAKVNEEIEFFATFPEDYGNEELNGKKVKFKATITNIYETPIYDDDFVKNNLGFDNRKAFEEQLVKDYATAQMLETIVDGSTVIKFPEREYNALVDEVEAYGYYFQQTYGYSYDIYLQIYQGVTTEEYINNTLKLELAYYAFAQAEGLVPSEEQINTAKEALIATYTANYKKQDSTLTDEAAREQAVKYVENNLGKEGIYDEAIFELVEEHFHNIYTISFKDATFTTVTIEKMPPMDDSILIK